MASVHSFVGRRLIIMSPPLGPSVRIIPSNRRYRVILIAIVISNIRMLATATFNVIDSMFACPIVLHIGWVRSCCCCCSFCFLSFFLALSLSPIPFISLSSRCQLMNESARFQMRTTDWTRSNLAIERVVCVCVCVCVHNRPSRKATTCKANASNIENGSFIRWMGYVCVPFHVFTPTTSQSPLSIALITDRHWRVDIHTLSLTHSLAYSFLFIHFIS